MTALKGDEVGNAGEFKLLEMLSSVSGMKIPESLLGLKNKEIRFEDALSSNEIKDFVRRYC